MCYIFTKSSPLAKFYLFFFPSQYAPPPNKPLLDDIDSEFGLHDYSLHLDLHGRNCRYLCGTFKCLFCRKGKVDGTIMSVLKIIPAVTSFLLISIFSVLRGETSMEF